MTALISRVEYAKVIIDGETYSEIGKGILIFLGVSKEDTAEDAVYLANKCINLRVFEDNDGKINQSLTEIGGKALIVSNFSLYANCKRGKRPDFTASAQYREAKPLYERFVDECKKTDAEVLTGVFGASMFVESKNDGPLNLILDTQRMR